MRRFLVLMAGMVVILIAAPGTSSAGCDLCGDLNGDDTFNIFDITAIIDWYFDPPILHNPVLRAA